MADAIWLAINLLYINLYNLYCSNMPFQKLSYKLDKFVELIDGEKTFYGYIKEKYLKEEETNE